MKKAIATAQEHGKMTRSLEIRSISGLSRKAFCDKYGIPVRTVEAWDAGINDPSDWVMDLLERVVREDFDDEYDAFYDNL